MGPVPGRSAAVSPNEDLRRDIGNRERNWYVVDAEGQTLGRLATQIADALRGKRKPEYTPHGDTGDFVVVVNAEKIAVTGNKLKSKRYYRHSGYPGGIRSRTLGEMLDRRPEEVIRRAVKGMLPRNRLARKQLTKLKVYAGPEHPHAAQKPSRWRSRSERRRRAAGPRRKRPASREGAAEETPSREPRPRRGDAPRRKPAPAADQECEPPAEEQRPAEEQPPPRPRSRDAAAEEPPPEGGSKTKKNPPRMVTGAELEPIAIEPEVELRRGEGRPRPRRRNSPPVRPARRSNDPGRQTARSTAGHARYTRHGQAQDRRRAGHHRAGDGVIRATSATLRGVLPEPYTEGGRPPAAGPAITRALDVRGPSTAAASPARPRRLTGSPGPCDEPELRRELKRRGADPRRPRKERKKAGLRRPASARSSASAERSPGSSAELGTGLSDLYAMLSAVCCPLSAARGR